MTTGRHRSANRVLPWFPAVLLFIRMGTFAGTLSDASSVFTYRYRVSNPGMSDTVERTMTWADSGCVVTYTDPPSLQSVTRCDQLLRTLGWHFSDTSRLSDVVSERRNDTLLVRGTHRGKPVSRAVFVGDAPWYQAIEFSLGALLQRGAANAEFWVVRPTDMVPFMMSARVDGETVIEVNGALEKCTKLTVSPAGIAGKVWHSSYWFRTSDCAFVKNEARRGLPPAPITRTELIVTGNGPNRR